MNKKWYQISIWISISILLNCLLKNIISTISLPLWLDSFGTAIAAYVLGPIPGAIVGATTNIIYGLQSPSALYYLVTNIAIGLMIGTYAHKGYFENVFDTVTACSVVTSVCAAISTVINVVVYQGSTGNEWGDGIFAIVTEYGLPLPLASFVGEFCLEFLDKFITMMLLYFIIKCVRKIRAKKTIFKNHITSLIVLVFTVFCLSTLLTDRAEATSSNTTNTIPDYSQYIRTVYSNANGLLSGEANDIATTEDGIIWIGTYAGLYRYSGNDFSLCNQFDKIKNVNCLFVDTEGRLWVGTNDDGLSICFDEQIINTFDEKHGFPSNSVRCVTQSMDGDFYVGTSGDFAVLSLAGGSKIVKTYSDISYAVDVTADNSGNIATVTSSGQLFLLNSENILASLQDKQYCSCEFSKDGILYVGTDHEGIIVFDVSNGTLKEISVIGSNLSFINSINCMDNGSIILCTDSEIGWMDGDYEYRHINTGNFNSSIDHMTMDYQGNLWFSSSRLGIMKLCASAFAEVYPEYNLESKVVNTEQSWKDLLYFGTDEGLDIIDTLNERVVENQLSSFVGDARVRCIMRDSKDRLWICAYGIGVICASSPDDYFVISETEGLYGTKPRCVIECSDGTYAISSEKGISLVKNKTVYKTIGKEDGLKNSLVLCLLETSDGDLWAGTDGGGISIIRNGHIINTLTRDDGLSSGVILRMVQDATSDNIYIITSNGICIYHSDGVINQIKSFPYSNNYDLVDIGTNKLYISSSAGIYIVNREEMLTDTIENYENLNYLSGIRGTFTANAWNYIDDDGNWYIAGGDGVTLFSIQEYLAQTHNSYRMLIRKVVLDKTVHYLHDEATITVSRDCDLITLKPEIINYSTIEPYICYYLEGHDEEKTTILQSELSDIVYTGLNSGSYRFHLAVLDGQNGKVIEELIYTIDKEAEIYDHLWFKLFFFTELILIVAWFTWFFTKKRSDKELQLQRKEIAFAKEQVRMGNETILAIAKTVDAKDQNTSQHSVRVSEYSVHIASQMGYSEDELENLRKAALLHDIGKIGIPDRVLNKPGKLTDDEFKLMKSHVNVGADILKDLTMIDHVQEGALYHHERYNGKGYNAGLSGKDIPEIARIIGIADAFDAMTANRVYRKKLSFETVLSELEMGRGEQFDPDILDIFLKLIQEGKIDKNQLYLEEAGNEKS